MKYIIKILAGSACFALFLSLFHNGILLFLPREGVIRYSQEAFCLILTAITIPLSVVILRRRSPLVRVAAAALLLSIFVTSFLLLRSSPLLAFVDRLKGWYGISYPFAFALLMVMLKVDEQKIDRLTPILLGIGLIFAGGILADSLLGVRPNIEGVQDKEAKFAMGAYRATFILDSPMGAGYVTASASLIALLCLWNKDKRLIIKGLAAAVLALSIAANLCCLSRGGTIILVGSIGIFGFIAGTLQLRHVLLALLAAGFFATFLYVNEDARDWLSSTLDFHSERSNMMRVSSWYNGLSLIHDSGRFGFGLGITRDLKLRTMLDLTNGENTMLHAWVEGGYTLAFCQGVWIILWFIYCVRAYFMTSGSRPLYISALIGINVMSWCYSFFIPLLLERAISILSLCWFGLLVYAMEVEYNKGIRVAEFEDQESDIFPDEEDDFADIEEANDMPGR